MYEEIVEFEEAKDAVILSLTATGMVAAIPVILGNFFACILVIPAFAFGFGVYISNRYSGLGSSLGVLLPFIVDVATGNFISTLAAEKGIEYTHPTLNFVGFLILLLTTGICGYLGGVYGESRH